MIVLFFTWFSIHPWNFAAADSHSSKLSGRRAAHQVSHPLPARPESNDEMALTEALAQIESTLATLHTRLNKGADTSCERAALKAHRQRIEQLDRRVRMAFTRVEQHLKAKKLPAAILERHHTMVSTYESEFATLMGNLQAIEANHDTRARQDKVKQALQHLKAKHARPKPQPLDPHHLPFRTPSGKVRKPKQRKEDFILSFVQNKVFLCKCLKIQILLLR
jgi:tellurite resistance-related uncharacterized protein